MKNSGERPHWPDQVFRRNLVDMTIPDRDPVLLSKFDPVDIVKTIAGAGFQSMTAYANSHVGLILLAHQDRADASQHEGP